MSNIRYLYLDESVFSEPHSYTGYGALLTEKEINNKIINKALENLKNDEDRFEEINRKKDDRTLKREYFHAADDSKNAHSHLCDQINKNIKASFSSNFIPEKEIGGKKNTLELMSKLSVMEIFFSAEPVRIIFEEREDLTIDFIKNWYKKMEDEVLEGLYRQPFIPAFFPNVQFDISEKSNPGLQIVDFLLWTINRKINKKSKWFDRLNISFNTEIQHSKNKNNWGSCDFDINKNINEFGEYHDEYYYKHFDFSKIQDNNLNNNLLVNFYIHAEKVIDFYSKYELPERLDYLKNQIINLADNLMKEDNKRIEKISTLYLKLFDSVPLIKDDTTTKDKQFLLLSKKYLSLTLNKHLMYGKRTKDFLLKNRRSLLENKPELLNFSN